MNVVYTILTFKVYGVLLIIIRLISAQRDFSVIERFGREALNGVHMPSLLEQPWMKNCYVHHYLSHIAHTGGTVSTEMQQSAIENELHALSAEYEHKLELPQFIVGFMVAMGLLGTFIGLLETLTGISGMLDGFGGSGANMDEQFMHLVGELRKPLAGMGIAFSASMFGLVTSLMLAMMMINLRRFIARILSCARNVMHDLTEMTQGQGASQPTEAELAALGKAGGSGSDASLVEGDASLQDIVYRAHDTSLLVSNRIDGLTKKIDVLLQAFEVSIQASQKTNDLLGFGPRMKETSEAMLEELKILASGQIEQQKLAKTLIDSNEEVSHIVSGVILNELKILNNGQFDHQKLSQSILEASSEINRTIGGVLLGELKNLGNGQAEQQKLTQKLIDGDANMVRITELGLQDQRQGQVNDALALKDLATRLVKIEESSNSTGKHLWDIKEHFRKLGAYSGVAEAILEGFGHQKLLLETLVAEDRNLQRRLVSIQQDIRERVAPIAKDGVSTAV